jgi:hypothetical protein
LYDVNSVAQEWRSLTPRNFLCSVYGPVLTALQLGVLALLVDRSAGTGTRGKRKMTEALGSHAPISVTLRVYRVSQEERTILREGVPYLKLYRYNPKYLYPKLNGYGDNGKRSLKLLQLLLTY